MTQTEIINLAISGLETEITFRHKQLEEFWKEVRELEGDASHDDYVETLTEQYIPLTIDRINKLIGQKEYLERLKENLDNPIP
jgi:hypothetical protein